MYVLFKTKEQRIVAAATVSYTNYSSNNTKMLWLVKIIVVSATIVCFLIE